MQSACANLNVDSLHPSPGNRTSQGGWDGWDWVRLETNTNICLQDLEKREQVEDLSVEDRVKDNIKTDLKEVG